MRSPFPIFQMTLVVLLLFIAIEPLVCVGQIPVVRRLLLGDIGAARVDRSGRGYVEINPLRCRQLGPELCEFFKQHEYAHINLNHFSRNISPRRAEAEADCYAAKSVSSGIANAAVNFFQSGLGGSKTHGSSRQRAARVANCSQTQRRTIVRSPRTQSNTRFAGIKTRPTQIIRRVRPQATQVIQRVRPRVTRTTTQSRPIAGSRSIGRVTNSGLITRPIRTTRIVRPTQTVVYRGR